MSELIYRKFTIPGPPVGKARARTVTQGGRTHTYTPEKTALYEQLVRDCYGFTHPGEKPFTGPVEIRVTAFMPIPKSWSQKRKAAAMAELIKPCVKPDGSNVLKSIEDGLNGAAYADDQQITLATVEKKYGPPHVEVELWGRTDDDPST